MKKTLFVVCLLVGMLLSSNALALTVYNQDFSSDTDGLIEWYSLFHRVETGPNGEEYALIQGQDGPYSGVFTKFGGYSSEWGTGFKTSMDIFLDPSWETGSGFDYSVAASNQAGGHLRDFIFHVAKDTSSNSLLVGGSNNSNFTTRENLESINHTAIVSAGWYSFEHIFSEKDGQLNVDLVLSDWSGTELFKETRSSEADLIELVGGNRYGWLTFVEVGDAGLGIDNILLERSNPIPEPTTILLFGFGLLGIAGLNRKK